MPKIGHTRIRRRWQRRGIRHSAHRFYTLGCSSARFRRRTHDGTSKRLRETESAAEHAMDAAEKIGRLSRWTPHLHTPHSHGTHGTTHKWEWDWWVVDCVTADLAGPRARISASSAGTQAGRHASASDGHRCVFRLPFYRRRRRCFGAAEYIESQRRSAARETRYVPRDSEGDQGTRGSGAHSADGAGLGPRPGIATHSSPAPCAAESRRAISHCAG